MSTESDKQLEKDLLETPNLLDELDSLFADDESLSSVVELESTVQTAEPDLVYINQQAQVLEFLRPGQQQQLLSVAFLTNISDGLSRTLAVDDLTTTELNSLNALPVCPGDLIATCLPEDSVPEKQICRVQLSCSEHFEQLQNGDIRANRYGYLSLQKSTLRILPPLWIDKDKLNAYWLLLGQRTIPIQKDWLEYWWKVLGIKVEIDSELFFGQAESLKNGTQVPGLSLLAQGQAPIHGQDAQIEIYVETAQEVGQQQADGSINFYEINFAPNTVADERIAHKKPATSGSLGYDIYGNSLPARSGKDRQLRCGVNVRVETHGEEEYFFAALDGAVRYRNDTLSIAQILFLNNGVNFETGNIDFSGEIYIKGEIMPGFFVKAVGDISIAGTVDNNTLITSQGRVTISQGVIGPKTVVTAGEDIYARFSQGAKLVAAGNIKLGSFAYHSTLLAGESIIVTRSSDPRGGNIMGGEVRSYKGIDAVKVGTPTWERTELCVGLCFQQSEVLERLQDEIEKHSRHIRQLLDFFGLTRIEPVAIRKRIERADSDAQRKGLSIRAKQLGQLAKFYQALLQKRDQYLIKIGPPADEAFIQISDKAYPGVIIRFGSKKLIIEEEKHHLSLQLIDNQIKELTT